MMDFDAAIRAHIAWKQRLNAYIRHPDSSLDPDVIALDTECQLGKWIHRECDTRDPLPEMIELMRAHADFHKAASDVVRRVNAGSDVTAEVALGAKSSFAISSQKIVDLVVKMWHEAA